MSDQPLDDEQVVLLTRRLRLRPLVPADADVLRRLWSQRDPRVPPHRRIGPDGRPTAADLAARIRDRPATARGVGLLAVQQVASGEVIGWCGLVSTDRGAPGEPELAFEVDAGARGQGYAAEAAAAVVHQARADGHQRLWATVWDWNTASRRLLGTLGFVETDRTEVDPERGTTLFTVLPL